MPIPDAARDAAHPEPPPEGPEPELHDDGAWGEGGGRWVRQVRTGERFVLLAMSGSQQRREVWEETVRRLEDVSSPVLLPPRALVARGAGLLYEPLPEVSFAQHLRDGGAADQAETLLMVADLAQALEQIHGAGIVLGRLSYGEVLRTDDGWALLLGPAADPSIPEPQHRPRLRRADVVLLCAAAATVLTGRRPVPGRARPPLSATNPLLPAAAAAVLDAVLDAASDPVLRDPSEPPWHPRAAAAADAASGGAHPEATAVPGGGPGRAGPAGPAGFVGAEVTAGELARILHTALEVPPDADPPVEERVEDRDGDGDQDLDEVLDSEREGDRGRDSERVGDRGRDSERVGDRGESRDGEAGQQRLAGLARRIAERRAAQEREDSGQDREPDRGQDHGRGERRGERDRARPAVHRTGRSRFPEARPGLRSPAPAGRSRSVLAGAVALVLGAGLLCSWLALSGPRPEPAPVVRDASPQTDAPDVPESPVSPKSTEPPASPVADAELLRADASAALPELVRVRGEALRRRDLDLLASVYVDGAPDLREDRATVAALPDDAAFADLSMEIVGVSVVPASGPERPVDRPASEGAAPASASASAAAAGARGDAERVRLAGTVRASGTGLRGGGSGRGTTSQVVTVELRRSADGQWRIADVLPG